MQVTLASLPLSLEYYLFENNYREAFNQHYQDFAASGLVLRGLPHLARFPYGAPSMRPLVDISRIPVSLLRTRKENGVWGSTS